MAIHIDIYAHLRDRELIKEGEKLTRYINHLEDSANKRAVTGAQGRTKKLIGLNDKLESSFDQTINKVDSFTKAVGRLEGAQKDLVAIGNRVIKTDEDAEKQAKELAAAEREVAAAKQDLVYKGQALTKSVRDETRARKDLNDESKKYTVNAGAITRAVNKNRRDFASLARSTNRLRNDTQSLHDSHAVMIKDSVQIEKSMLRVKDATEKTARERRKYREILRTEGVTSRQVAAQTLRIRDAHEAENRVIRDTNRLLSDTIDHRRAHNAVVDHNSDALDNLARRTGALNVQTDRLLASNKGVIDQNLALKRQFDGVSDATKKAYREYTRFDRMALDNTVSADALRAQLLKSNDAFEGHKRAVDNAGKSLDDFREKQEQLKRAALEKDRQAFMGRQTPGQFLARNVGALTPLGTLSPSVLIPVAGILGTVGDAAVTASQSLALLPAAGAAAAAGIGTLTVGMWGFGDALKGMGDPKKFAEALHLLSPNAQQAALHIKQLVDGPLGDLKRATQDALFKDVGSTVQQLTATFGPTIQKMTTSIAATFNKMFTGISFQMMTPEMQGRIGNITTNIADMFERLRPGAAALVSAFTKIAETGSGFLPGLADSISSTLQTFNQFITKAQADGSLQNFISKGIDAVKTISKWLLQFGQDIYKVFGNKSPEDFMNMLNGVKDVALGLIEVFRAVAVVMNAMAPVVKYLADLFGGWENVLGAIVFGGIINGLWKLFKWSKELLTVFGLIGPASVNAAKGVGALNTAAAVTAGGAATTAAAKQTAATTASTFAAAGTTAGKGFSSRLIGVIKGAGWVGLGVTIAQAVGDGLRDGAGGWRDAIADGLDPGKALNPEYWIDKFFPNLRNPNAPSAAGATAPNFYKDWYPAGANPAGPTVIPDPTIPGVGDLPLPNVPLDANGKAMSDSDILNMYRGQLPRDSYAVDPFTDPITGQKLSPMLPMGPNGMPEYPAGGVPGTPSIMGPVMPQYNPFGQLTGYGANMVDPEAVFDAQLAVTDKARDLEEANKDLLAARQAGILSAEEINDLDRKVMDQKLGLHKALVQLGKAQTGDVEKLKKETKNAGDALGDFGASLDKDFGISKGLSGIAENLTKFLANLAFAPAFGAIRGAQAALGFPGGEGSGSGLMGMAASSMGWYKGGPRDPEVAAAAAAAAAAQARSGQVPSYTPSSTTPTSAAAPGARIGAGLLPGAGLPSGAAARFALNPNNVSTAGLKPQAMALLGLVQGMPQFKNVPLTSAKAGREGDQFPWHPSGTGLDFGLDANNPAQSALGDQLKTFLEANKELFGINHVLWKTMQGGNHFNHLHVGLNGAGNGRPDTSPLAQGMGGVVPPAGGLSPVSLGGASIPIPLPVTIVGGNIAASGPVPIPLAPSPPPRASVLPVPTPPPAGSLAPTNLGGLLGVPSFASGGEVPIVAHSGEHVLTRDDVAAMGGQAAVYNFRRGLRSYEVGGAVEPTDLGGLLGVGDTPPPPPPPTPPPPAGPPLAAEAPTVPGVPTPVAPPPVPTVPESALPPGVQTPGTVIGAQVEAPEGYGSGLSIGGGLVGLAQGAAMSAISAAGMAGDASGAMGGGSAGAAVANAALQIGFQEAERAIEYLGQVAGIGAQGLLETFLPAGGSELAQNNWATRWIGGIAGAAPAIANLAGGVGASNQSTLAGVGGPPTPEQIAAQSMDPNRTQHTGAGAPAGPYTGVNIENYVVAQNEDRAGQDLARYQPAPGAR